MANRRVKCASSDRFPLLGLQNHCGQWLQPWNQKTIVSCQESYNKRRQCVEKQRHYSANKSPYSQSYAISSGPVRLSELDREEGRSPKIDAFSSLRRLLKVPCTARRLNQSVLKEINPEYSLEGLTLKLKVQYFAPLMQIDDSSEKSLMLGKIKGRRDCQRMRWLDSITVAINMNLGKCFPDGSDDKASVCNAGDPGLIPGLGRSPGEGNGSPLQYSCLENPMDGGAW